MKTISILLLCSLLTNYSFSQVDKGNWLIGGNGFAKFYKQENINPGGQIVISRQTDVNANILIGRFVADRFVIGAMPYFASYRSKVLPDGNIHSRIDQYGLGVFTRYYMQPSDKAINFLFETSYQAGVYSFVPTKGRSSMFSASAGSVFFFNSSVGLEVLAGYQQRRVKIGTSPNFTDRGLDINIGFQFYLEKD